MAEMQDNGDYGGVDMPAEDATAPPVPSAADVQWWTDRFNGIAGCRAAHGYAPEAMARMWLLVGDVPAIPTREVLSWMCRRWKHHPPMEDIPHGFIGATARKQVVEATELGYKYLTALFDSTHSSYQWNARLFPWNRNTYFPRVLAHGDTFPGGIVAGRVGGTVSTAPPYPRPRR